MEPIRISDDPLSIPIYIYTEETQLPTDGIYYILANDGIWLKKDNGLLSGMVRVNGIGGLKELKPQAELHTEKIPLKIIFRALLFFRRVYKRFRAESALFLMYSKENKAYDLVCPEQEVAYSGVHYKPEDYRKEGFLPIGTIHSHCDFSAYHSGTDVADEAHFDGIHITFGHIDKNEFSIAASLVMNQSRFKISPLKVMEALEELEYKPGFQWNYQNIPNNKKNKKEFRYSVIEDEIKGIEDFPAFIVSCEQEVSEWMTKVRSHSYYRPIYSSPSRMPSYKTNYEEFDSLKEEAEFLYALIKEKSPLLDEDKIHEIVKEMLNDPIMQEEKKKKDADKSGCLFDNLKENNPSMTDEEIRKIVKEMASSKEDKKDEKN